MNPTDLSSACAMTRVPSDVLAHECDGSNLGQVEGGAPPLLAHSAETHAGSCLCPRATEPQEISRAADLQGRGLGT